MSTAIGMSITNEPIILLEDSFVLCLLPGALILACTNGNYYRHIFTAQLISFRWFKVRAEIEDLFWFNGIV
jgi:hypothetical protein